MDARLSRYAAGTSRRDHALSYSTKYERHWHKRLSTRRETRLLTDLLDRIGSQQTVLDVPCGAGRLTPTIAPYAGHLFEADFSGEMLSICRSLTGLPDRSFGRVNALELPFGDGLFDLVVSIRLCHHIGDEGDRLRYFRELLRVSRGHVLATFFEFDSVKNRLRRLRTRLLGRSPKRTLRLAQVAAVAAEAGFAVRDWRMISSVMSGHRFVLLSKADAGGAQAHG